MGTGGRTRATFREEGTPGNITMEWSSRVLEQKYYPPIYWPSASKLH
jgi:hypothetical protein